MSDLDDSQVNQVPSSSNTEDSGAEKLKPSQPNPKNQSSMDTVAKIADDVVEFIEKFVRAIIKEAKPILKNLNSALQSSTAKKNIAGEQVNENTPPSVPNPTTLPVTTAETDRTRNVNNLGAFLDGWADLIEGMGERAEEVRETIVAGLYARNMPEIKVAPVSGYVTEFGGERRNYTITQTAPGASTTIYVGKHGTDLFVAWRTFIKPVLNWVIIGAVIAVSALLGFVTGGTNEVGGGFFATRTVYSLSGFIIYTLIFIVLFAVGTGFVSRFLKGNALALFFIEPNIFDADDIAAMSLSAHKTLLRALDSAGIDVSKLRIKQTFKGGRRGEDV